MNDKQIELLNDMKTNMPTLLEKAKMVRLKKKVAYEKTSKEEIELIKAYLKDEIGIKQAMTVLGMGGLSGYVWIIKKLKTAYGNNQIDIVYK